jgi:hypothetical protein
MIKSVYRLFVLSFSVEVLLFIGSLFTFLLHVRRDATTNYV